MDFALVFCLLGNIHMQDWKWIEIRIRCTFRNDFKPLLCTDVNWILTLKCQIFWGGPKVEDFLSMNESESCLTRPRSNCCAGISTPLLYLCDMLKVWQSCSTCWFQINALRIILTAKLQMISIEVIWIDKKTKKHVHYVTKIPFYVYLTCWKLQTMLFSLLILSKFILDKL